jgi:flavocytochrome c
VNVDVIVIGSGVAGMSAAIEAARGGVRVVVLEREQTVGGASVMSGAACCVVGSPLQRDAGIHDDVELALSDWAKTGGPTADLSWARRYLEESLDEVYTWCESFGIRWISVNQSTGNTVPRWHVPEGWGRAVIEALVSHAESIGVSIVTGATAEQIVIDDDRVRGVVATVGDGSVEYLAPAVIVCAGGFAGNPDMVRDSAPHLQAVPRLLGGSSPTAVGRGHQLLRSHDVMFTALDHIWVYPNATPDPQDPSGRRGVGVKGLEGDIWINRAGRRFHDETQLRVGSGATALLAQPDQTAWCIFNATEASNVALMDNEYWGSPAGPNTQTMPEFWELSRFVWYADSPGEMADVLGLPTAEVVPTIEMFNEAIALGLQRDPEFGRPLSGLAPLTGPGLVAIQFFPMTQKNFGGVLTDSDCRVTSTSGLPIPGLFAAGEVAGMAGGHINGIATLEGTAFGPCLYSGRIAGAAVARALAFNGS